MSLEHIHQIAMEQVKNDDTSLLHEYWEYVLEQFAIPFCYFCIKLIYAIYAHSSIYNVMIFLIKWVPMSVYMHKIKNIYISSRERIKQQQMELEDIKLQIQIVNTVKITLRCSEFAEREQLLKQRVKEFHKVRARVREIIAVNEELRNASNNSPSDDENVNSNRVSEEECKLIVDLLKELKYDQIVRHETEKNNCCQNSSESINEISGYAIASEAGEPAQFEEKAYTSASDTDNKQDYNIKIAKVTIVYRVAYLRHYIKLRKGKCKLIKRMNHIKKLLNDWQKTLNMVINSNRLSMLTFNMQHNMEITPRQEAVEEYSKPNAHSFFDSDSDFRNNGDNYYEDYNMSWIKNHQYRPHVSEYDNFNLDTARKCLENETDLNDCYDLYNNEEQKCQCKRAIEGLGMVPEETISQVEIEKNRSVD